jgi:hypothetical protein
MVPGLSCWHLSTAGNIAREVDTIIILCEPSFGSSSLKILLERRFYFLWLWPGTECGYCQQLFCRGD